MLRTMLKSKIHRATVTRADLHYVGSITIDPATGSDPAALIRHSGSDDPRRFDQGSVASRRIVAARVTDQLGGRT
jgi:Aspartate decarboxylase